MNDKLGVCFSVMSAVSQSLSFFIIADALPHDKMLADNFSDVSYILVVVDLTVTIVIRRRPNKTLCPFS